MFAIGSLELVGRLSVLAVGKAFLSGMLLLWVCGAGEAHFQWRSDHFLFLIIQIDG